MADVRGRITRREREVLTLLRARLSNAEIAAHLHISVRTAESHVGSVLRKLGVTRRQAVAGVGGLPAVQEALHAPPTAQGTDGAPTAADLPPAVRETLCAAAVVGSEGGADLLAAILDRPTDAIRRHLKAGVSASLVVDGPGPGEWSMPDQVVAALTDGLDDDLCARWHHRAATFLRTRNRQPGTEAEWQVEAAIAGHMNAARPRVTAAACVDQSMRAGELTAKRRHFGEAARHYAAAARVLTEVTHDPALEFRLRLAWGQVSQRAGDPAHRDQLLEAAALAERQGDAHQFARAVLSLVPAGWASRFGRSDPVAAACAERALRMLPTAEISLRSQLLALLAADASVAGQDQQGRRLGADAEGLARRSEDDAALRFVLPRLFWVGYDPDDLPGRRRLVDEVVERATRAADAELETYGRACRVDLAVEAGDLRSAWTDVIEVASTGPTLGQPFYAWLALEKRAGLAQLRGLLRTAERVGRTALTVGVEAPIPAAESVWVGQLAIIRLEQDRPGEVIAPVRAMVSDVPGFPVWRAVLAWAYAAAGRTKDARNTLAELTQPGLSALPRNNTWRAALHALANVATLLHDRPLAEEVYQLLLPSRGRLEWFGGGSLGPSDLMLGELSSVLDRTAVAEQHLADAVTLSRAVGALRYRTRAIYALTALAGR